MISGAEALTDIDAAIQQVRRDLAATHRTMEETAGGLIELDASETDAYQALARHRLGETAGGARSGRFEQLTNDVREMLAQRAGQIADLSIRVAESMRAQEALEAERERERKSVDAVRSRVDEATAWTQERLAEDDAYQAQLELARKAAEIAERARQKTETAERDYAEKGRPYEADPLFFYLWSRGYGTSRYRTWPIIRTLDDWIARLCGFGEARRNYAALTEIPKRLAEHMAQVEIRATAEAEALEALERAALTADGVDTLNDELNAEEEKLAKIDTRISEAEAAHLALVEDQERFASFEDGTAKRAVEQLATGLRRDTLAELRRDAEATATRKDDALVQRLSQLARRRHDIAAAIEQRKQTLQSLKVRLTELEGIRREFKDRGLGSDVSAFGDRNLLNLLLMEFLRGSLSRGGLWDELRRQHRYNPRRSRPDFGSGGLPSGGRGWPGFPTGRGGSGGFGFPSGRSMGRGGFRTGGGF